MALNSYLTDKKNTHINKSKSIVELLKESKLREKREKRQNVYIAAAAVSVLAISGFIISQ